MRTHEFDEEEKEKKNQRRNSLTHYSLREDDKTLAKLSNLVKTGTCLEIFVYRDNGARLWKMKNMDRYA